MTNKTYGKIFPPALRIYSDLGSSRTLNEYFRDFTKDFTLDKLRGVSVFMLMIWSPDSAYFLLNLSRYFSSLTQGAHQVAQKAINMGPSSKNDETSVGLPLSIFNDILGNLFSISTFAPICAIKTK